MKIQLENFGQHEKLLVEVADHEIMFGIGKNRVGKSTIRDAIEFALLGTCQIRGFRTQKDTRAYMIRNGASHARVTFIAKGLCVRRSITSRGGHKIEMGKGQAWIEVNASEYAERMTWDPDALRIALDCDWFYRMDEAARRAVLISVKDSEGLDARSVWDAFGTGLTSYADEDPERQGKVRGLCEVVSIEGFAAGNSQAVEERRVAKRLREDVERKISAMDEPSGDLNGIDCTRGALPEHEARLAELEAQLETARSNQARSAGSLSGQIEEAERAFETARASNEETRALRVEFVCGGEKKPAEWTQDRLEKLKAKIAKKVSGAVRAVNETAVVIQGMEQRLASAIATKESASEPPEHPGNCPAMPFEMKCKVKLETFAKAYLASGCADSKKDLDATIASIKQEIELQQEAQGECQRILDGHSVALEKCQSAINAAIVIDSKRSAAQATMEDADEHLQELVAQVEETQEGPTAEEVQAIADKVELGRQVVAHRKAFDESNAELVRLETEKNALNLEVEFWNEIEKLLKPDGIEKALAALASSVFAGSLEKCDELAKVRLTDEMDISINGQHISSCSKSEQLCGGIAFQAAMSKHLGTGFLVVDELDKLDAHWKRQFQAWAADCSDEWMAGVLALATTNSDPPQPPPDGFRTLWLRADESPVVLGGDMSE